MSIDPIAAQWSEPRVETTPTEQPTNYVSHAWAEQTGSEVDGQETPPPGHTIEVEGTEEEVAAIERWLTEVRRTPSGMKMLREIDESGHTVTIRDVSADTENEISLPGGTRPDDFEAAITPDQGSDSTLYIDTAMPDEGYVMVYKPLGGTFRVTADEVFVHELSHSHGEVTGNRMADRLDEEADAVAAENQYRLDKALLNSNFYDSPVLPPVNRRATSDGFIDPNYTPEDNAPQDTVEVAPTRPYYYW